MKAKRKSTQSTTATSAATRQFKAQLANPFVGAGVVETLLNVNTVLDYLADAVSHRDAKAPEMANGDQGLSNILFALHNALAHQVIALHDGPLPEEAANG